MLIYHNHYIHRETMKKLGKFYSPNFLLNKSFFLRWKNETLPVEEAMGEKEIEN